MGRKGKLFFQSIVTIEWIMQRDITIENHLILIHFNAYLRNELVTSLQQNVLKCIFVVFELIQIVL